MKVSIGNAMSVLIPLKLKTNMAINCLELREFCNPYNLEIILHVLPGMYGLFMFVKCSNISKHIKLSHFYCT